MPVSYSTLNNLENVQTACSASILPLKTKVRGPAPPGKEGEVDIVDEAIDYFRVNVLHRNFKPSGGADLVLAYLTVFIGECIRDLSKVKDKKDATKSITQISMSGNFSVPGSSGFCLSGFFEAPQNRAESDLFTSYFRQLREETGKRLIDVVYNDDGTPNKWWMSFSKKKFMNIAKT